jgi:hypothetical protein
VLREHVLRVPKVKAVIQDDVAHKDESGSKLILIQAEVEGGAGGAGGGGRRVPGKVREFAATNGGEAVPWVVRIGYEQMNAVQVLRKLLPPGLEIPSAFEQV